MKLDHEYSDLMSPFFFSLDVNDFIVVDLYTIAETIVF